MTKEVQFSIPSSKRFDRDDGSSTDEEYIETFNDCVQQKQSVRHAESINKWPQPYRLQLPMITNEDACMWVIENKSIIIRTVTWNLCAKPPPRKCHTLFSQCCHLYVVGTEECERSIASSAINPSKQVWESYLIDTLGSEYVPIRSHTLQAIHLIIFAHKSIARFISQIKSTAVATGMQNTLGNKGAVTIYLCLLGTSFIFTNAHFGAGQHAVLQRNKNFHTINTITSIKLNRFSSRNKMDVSPVTSNNLKAGVDSSRDVDILPASELTSGNEVCDFGTEIGKDSRPRRRWSKWYNEFDMSSLNDTALANTQSVVSGMMKSSGLSQNQLCPDFDGHDTLKSNSDAMPTIDQYADRVIFMGDLNYRIIGDRVSVTQFLELNMHGSLIANDQLSLARQKRLVFENYIEPPLNFLPTYKYDIGTDRYDAGRKQRIPSWTDRILYVDRGLNCLEYDCEMSIKTSDHKPVYATFEAKLNEGTTEMWQHLSDTSKSPIGESCIHSQISATKANSSSNHVSESPSCNGHKYLIQRQFQNVPEFSSESQVCSVM